MTSPPPSPMMTALVRACQLVDAVTAWLGKTIAWLILLEILV